MAWARTLYLACFCAAVFTDSTLSLPLNHDLVISRKIRSATDDVRIERVVNETTGTIQDVCIVDRVTYREGDPVPTNSLCETCLCQPPGFACTFTKCDFKPGCRPIERPDRCCPDYACNCEMDGRTYLNGEKIEDPENPCQACYCQGGSIRCLAINCFWRDDCEPRERPGRCCPSFDHCPPTLGNTTASSPSASEQGSQLPPTSSAGSTNNKVAISEWNTTEEETTVDMTTSATPTVTTSDVVAETFTGTTVEQTTVSTGGSTTAVPTLFVTNASAAAEVIPEQQTTQQQLTSSSSSSQLPTLAKSVVMDLRPSLADGVRLMDLAAAVVGQQPLEAIAADGKATNEIPEAAVDPGVASNIDMVMGNTNNNPGNNEALLESAYEDILADQAAADLMDSEELYEQGVEQDYPEEQMPMDPAGALSISRTGMDVPAYDDEDLTEDEIAAEEDAAVAAGLAGMLRSPGQASSSMVADPRQQQQSPLLSSARPAVQHHQQTPSGLLVMSGDHQHGGSAGGGVVDLAKLFPVGASSKSGPQPMFPLSQEETDDDRGSAGALELEPDELAEALLMANSDKANQPLDLASDDIPLGGKTPHQQPSWSAPQVDTLSASTPTAVMPTSGISNAADSLLSTSAGISQSDSSSPSSTLNISGVIMAEMTTTAPTTLDPMTTVQPTDSTSNNKVEESTSTTDAVTSLPSSSNDQEVAGKAETTSETQSTTTMVPELTMTTTAQPGAELSLSTVTMLGDSAAGTEATTPVIDSATITESVGTPTATERTEATTTLPIRGRDDVVNDLVSADDTEDLFNNQAAAFLQSLASGVQGQDDTIGSAVVTTTLASLPTSTDIAELTTAETATTVEDNEDTFVAITVAPHEASPVAAADEEAMHLDGVAAVAGPSQDDEENQEAEASTQPPLKASPTTDDAVEVATTDAPSASTTVTVEEVQENEKAEATTLNSPSMEVAQQSEESSGADTSAVDESTSEAGAETTTEDATEGQDEAEVSPVEARSGGEEVSGDQEEPAGESRDEPDGTSEAPKLDEDEARTTAGSSDEAANEATTVEPSLVDDTEPATASTVEETAESMEGEPAANAAQDDSATEELDRAREQEEAATTEATVEEALPQEAAKTEEPETPETEAPSPTSSPFDGQETVKEDEAQEAQFPEVVMKTAAVPVTETQASNEEREDKVAEESTTTAVDDDSTAAPTAAAPVDAAVVPAVVLDPESQNLENQAVVAEDEDSQASNSQQESALRSLDDNHHDTGMDESTTPLPVPVFEVPIVPEKYPQLCGTDEKEGDNIGDWNGANNEGSQQRNNRRCRKQEETEEDNQIDSEEQAAETKGIKEHANAHEEKEDIHEPKEDELVPETKEEEEVDAPKEEENRENALTLPTTVEPPTTESDVEEADDGKQEDIEDGAKEDEAAVSILEEHGGEPAASDDGDEKEQDGSTTPLTTAEQPVAAEEESSTDEPESTDSSEGLQEDAEPADAKDQEESATDEPETTNTGVEENTEPAAITEGEESTDEPATTDADTEEDSDRVPPTTADDGVPVEDDTTNNGEVPVTESTDDPEASQPESTTVESAPEEEATSNKQVLDSNAALPTSVTDGDEKTDEDRTEGAIELAVPSVPDATSSANKARRIDGPIVDKVPQSLSTELTIEAGLRVSPEISDDDVDQSARETNWKNFISLLLNNSSPSTPSSDASSSVSPPAAVGDKQQQTDSEANSNTEPSVADDAAILFQSLVGSPLLRKLVL